MSSVSAADRAVIERWSGRLRNQADEDETAERIDRLGNAHMAALEKLMIDKADMLRSAAKVKSGDDSADHSENLKRIDITLSNLVTVIINLDLSTDDDMVAEAGGAAASQATAGSITVTARNTRRG